MNQTYTFHLDRLGIGEQQLRFGEMLPEHRTRVESTLSRHLLNRKPVNEFLSSVGNKVNFDFNIGWRGTAVRVAGQSPHLFASERRDFKALRKIGRVAQFYQHTGRLARKGEEPAGTEQRNRIAAGAVKAMTTAQVPGANGKILTLSSISENTLSLARDVMRSIPTIGPNHPLPHNLAFPAGIIWSGFAVREVKGGWNDYKRAETIGDGEGRRRAVGRMTTGSLGAAGSAVFLAGKAALSAGAAASAITVLSFTADITFGIGSVVGMGLSSLGIYRCVTFKNRLDEYYKNPKLTKEEQIQGTLEFLRDLLAVTPEERTELAEKIAEENPSMGPQERGELLEQKLMNLAETKVKFLKRRTSNKSLQLILTQVEPLLLQLKDPATKAKAMIEAEVFIQSIRKETNWKMALYITGLVASIISLVGVILSNVVSLGTAPFIIMGIASTIFLLITAYNFILQLMKKESEGPALQMAPLDAPIHLS